jgi:hypothetical protein
MYVTGLASMLTWQFPLLDLFDLSSDLCWRAMVLACLSVHQYWACRLPLFLEFTIRYSVYAGVLNKALSSRVTKRLG